MGVITLFHYGWDILVDFHQIVGILSSIVLSTPKELKRGGDSVLWGVGKLMALNGACLAV